MLFVSTLPCKVCTWGPKEFEGGDITPDDFGTSRSLLMAGPGCTRKGPGVGLLWSGWEGLNTRGAGLGVVRSIGPPGTRD